MKKSAIEASARGNVRLRGFWLAIDLFAGEAAAIIR